jgi:hypothetical protein
MGHYIANLRDIEFCLFDLLGREKVMGTSLYSDVDRDTAMGMLEEVKSNAFKPNFIRINRIIANGNRNS